MDISEITDPKLKRRILDQWAAEDQTRGVSSRAVVESGDQNVAVAEDAGKAVNAVRCFTRVTYRCFRCRSLDDENQCTKFFTDALRFAGILFDDSKKWARIVVIEEIVTCQEDERTEIEIDYVDA